jgi:hypothetical protein
MHFLKKTILTASLSLIAASSAWAGSAAATAIATSAASQSIVAAPPLHDQVVKPDAVGESSIGNGVYVSYQIKLFSGKKLDASPKVFTRLKQPTPFSSFVSYKSTKCVFKDEISETSLETGASKGLSMSIIPSAITDDGLMTAFVASFSTADVEEPTTIDENCQVRVGDTSTLTTTRVANLPWDKATTFTLKDGRTLEITPHLEKVVEPVVKIKA